MQHFYFVRGLPGSGKSTFARECLNAFVVCEADMWFEQFNGGKFDPARLKEAHAWCLEQAKQGLILGHNVVVANTFTRRWEMQPYRDMIAELQRDSNFPIKIFEVIMNGNFESVHNVPTNKIIEMRERFEY